MKAMMKQMVAAEAGNHQHTEPTDIDAVVGVCDPGAKSFPVALTSAANCGGHVRKEDGIALFRNRKEGAISL